MMLTRALVPILLLSLFACSVSEPPPASQVEGKPVVFTVNYPLQYFAERIGGDLVETHFPAPPTEDPAYWKPGAAIIQEYQQADLILLNGAGYAKWTASATLPVSRMVDTSTSLKDRLIEIEDLSTHTHGPEGEHAYGGATFTTWLDPSLALGHAEAVAEALARLLPEHAVALQQNLAGLQRDLESVDTALKGITGEYDGVPLLGSHPVYQYLARAYGLNLRQMHWEPQEMPPGAEWRKLDDLLQEHRAGWMIWEAPPSPQIVSELETRGVRCAVFYTVNNTPEEGDFLSVMQENVDRLEAVFQ